MDGEKLETIKSIKKMTDQDGEVCIFTEDNKVYVKAKDEQNF